MSAHDLIFENTFEHAAVGLAHLSLEGAWLRVNRKLCEMTGYSAEELMALGFQGITHPDDLARDVARLDELLSRNITAYEVEKRYVRKDGGVIWVALSVSIVLDADGHPVYGVSVMQEISARKRAELEIAVTYQRYLALFEQMPEGVLLVDSELRIIGHNREAERQLQYSAEQMRNLHIIDIEVMDDMDAIGARRKRLATIGRDDFESIYRMSTGELLDVDVSVKLINLLDGQQMYQVLFRDISEKKHAAQVIEKMAYGDSLTGLANRTLLSERLKQGMLAAHRRGQLLAVVFLDLDGFKAINDQHGHAIGDLLLRALAARMKVGMREIDTLARLGGDEFVAVFQDVPDAEACVPMLMRLLTVCSQPVDLGVITLKVSASLGVTFYPQTEDVDADQLLRQADQAMYQAKVSGKNRHHIFDAEKDRTARGLHAGLERIRLALQNQEFVLHYQPKVNMKTRALVGVEALIRWQHPVEGLLAPGMFLPLIENHRLSVDVGEWVIHQALLQLAEWQTQGLQIPISVNISAMQIQQHDFIGRLQESLQKFPTLQRNGLQLEILETSALEDIEQVARFVGQCKDLGVDFALDDFGTGYSSLKYLKRLPVEVVKIDQSFVRDMLLDQDNMSILDGILWIMRQLQRNVIAEGVETLAHGRALMDLGCELAQGYGIGRPMSVADLPAWKQRWENDLEWKEVALVPRTAI